MAVVPIPLSITGAPIHPLKILVKSATGAGITVTGNKSFDQNLIISISGLAVGDKVQIPGTDVFSKAITKLWKQNLIADVEVFFTNLVGNNLYVELAIVERPRLADFKFIGIKKGEREDLEAKVALSKDKVVTDNMKVSAIDIIKRFYTDKAYRNATVSLREVPAVNLPNAVVLIFTINKGNKVKVNSLNFANNENVPDSKLKKQMKGTKEMSRFTLHSIKYSSPYGDTNRVITFKEYFNDFGYLSISKTKDPDPSKYIGTGKNTTAIGTPIGFGGGRMRIGGQFLSVQVNAVDIVYGTFPVTP